MGLTWKVELHSHTIYSHDSLTRLERIQEICHQRGIDKIAITDHNRAQGALQMARTYPMLVIPGIEVMTTGGELLAWFIRDEVPAGLSPQETIRLLRAQDAAIGVAHPFDRYRKGAWTQADLDAIVDQIDVIEVFNARCLHSEDNAKARAYAQQHQKLMSSGSDAHVEREYGRATIQMPPFANNAESFRKALAGAAQQEEALSDPFVHLGSTAAKWAKRLVPSLRA